MASSKGFEAVGKNNFPSDESRESDVMKAEIGQSAPGEKRIMTRAKGKAVRAVQPRIKMNLFRSHMCPASHVTKLLRDGTLRTHVHDHINRFGESNTGEYNVKVSSSGMITVGSVN